MENVVITAIINLMKKRRSVENEMEGGPLTAEEFADSLWDLKKSDF